MQGARFHFVNFCLMMLGYANIYESVFMFVNCSKTKVIPWPLPGYALFELSVQSQLAYSFVFTALYIPFVLVGVSFLNYAYLREGVANDMNLWFPFFMASMAMPLTFALLNTLQRKTPIDMFTAASLAIVFLAVIVRYWKHIAGALFS